ncbi:hypothetical protein LENED_001393 [Lentinula edodes]|uniref:Uncharacterized protein n=1 Tax=Lentinula edodes TaxID=5353 RepID=A0A1Q3DY27_LENED|nr:hypothetical protein LENED_001393 [Lentinula edodes]
MVDGPASPSLQLDPTPELLNKTMDNGEKQEAAILMDILKGLGEEQMEKQISAAPATRYLLLQFPPARIKWS